MLWTFPLLVFNCVVINDKHVSRYKLDTKQRAEIV